VKNTLMVIEDFFPEKEFKFLQNETSKLKLIPRKNEVHGAYGFTSNHLTMEEYKWLFDRIETSIPATKGLKIIDPSFHYRRNHKKVLPHIDRVDYIFLCYLKGPELMYNGTGLYNEDKKLDRYIGFKENRALFFNPRTHHTDLQALGPSSFRWSLNIFYNESHRSDS